MARVWLLGGNGNVGAELIRQLETDGRDIITVSRRAADDTHRHQHVQMDLSAPNSALSFGVGDRVVNLTEATAQHFLSAALEAGAVFIETSATENYVLGMRDAASTAGGHGCFVSCVGVAPGLTNLMAHHVLLRRPDTRHLSIAVELGLGAHAGPAATRWFFETLGAIDATGLDRNAYHMSFTSDRPSVPVLPFPFVEERILTEAYAPKVETVRTHLALSPSWVTRILRMGLRLGLGPGFTRHAGAMTGIMLSGPAFGRATTRIVVQASDGSARETAGLRLFTGEQGRATATIIAAVVRSRRPQPASLVSTIVDWVTLEAVIPALEAECPDTLLTPSGRGDDPALS